VLVVRRRSKKQNEVAEQEMSATKSVKSKPCSYATDNGVRKMPPTLQYAHSKPLLVELCTDAMIIFRSDSNYDSFGSVSIPSIHQKHSINFAEIAMGSELGRGVPLFRLS
jgi:hypothetical protein